MAARRSRLIVPLIALLIVPLNLTGCDRQRSNVAPVATPTTAEPYATATRRPPDPTPTAIPRPTPRRLPSPTPRPGMAPRLSLALGERASPAQAGLFVARERGYYAEAGFDVFFHVTPSRAAALEALVAGRDDLALVSAPDLVRVRPQGPSVVSILAITLARGTPPRYDLVLATSDRVKQERSDHLRAFLLATARGYGEVGRDPAIGLMTLGRADADLDRAATERALAEHAGEWAGAPVTLMQSEERWRQTLLAATAQGTPTSQLEPAALFSNDLLVIPPAARTPPGR